MDSIEIIPAPPIQVSSNEEIEQIESALLNLPQAHIPLTHRFSPGCYLREVMMPAGTFVIGHEHKTRHFNIVLTGKAVVMIDGQPAKIEAPCIFESGEGVRKVLFILEDMRWCTVHPTEETDLPALEELLIVKSPSFLKYQDDIQKLSDLLKIETPIEMKTSELEGNAA